MMDLVGVRIFDWDINEKTRGGEKAKEWMVANLIQCCEYNEKIGNQPWTKFCFKGDIKILDELFKNDSKFMIVMRDLIEKSGIRFIDENENNLMVSETINIKNNIEK